MQGRPDLAQVLRQILNRSPLSANRSMTFSQTPETGCADGESELERLAAVPPPDILRFRG